MSVDRVVPRSRRIHATITATTSAQNTHAPTRWTSSVASYRSPKPVELPTAAPLVAECLVDAGAEQHRERRGERDDELAHSDAEHFAQLDRHRHVELRVRARRRLAVGAPAHEARGVAEAVALQVLERDLGDQLDAQRLPAQVLARVPPALRAGPALAVAAPSASAVANSAHSRHGWSSIAPVAVRLEERGELARAARP